MTFPIFTGDDFAVIWAHIRNIKDGYFIDIPFIALIVAFIFYFFTRELPTKSSSISSMEEGTSPSIIR